MEPPYVGCYEANIFFEHLPEKVFQKWRTAGITVCDDAGNDNGGKIPVYFFARSRYSGRLFPRSRRAVTPVMIKVQNLVKQFGAKRAVDEVSFAVERGE